MVTRKYRKSRNIKPKKSIFKTRYFWVSLFSFFIFISLAYIVIFSDFFQVKEVSVFGNDKVVKEKIEDIALRESTKSFLGIKTKSIFLYSREKIAKNILHNYPEIEEINISLDYPSRLLVEVKERKSSAIFCQNQIINSHLEYNEPNEAGPRFVITKDNCFYMDDSGIIFEEVLRDPDSFFIQVPDLENIIKPGDYVVSSENLTNIIKIENFLRDNLKLESKVANISNSRVNIAVKDGFEIYFELESDIDWQLTKLRLVLEEEIQQEKRQELEYIDVRYSNFAPYKYRNQE